MEHRVGRHPICRSDRSRVARLIRQRVSDHICCLKNRLLRLGFSLRMSIFFGVRIVSVVRAMIACSPQGGAPIDQIGGNEESPQAIMSLLISDCGAPHCGFKRSFFLRVLRALRGSIFYP
jgi:hypothetical protein